MNKKKILHTEIGLSALPVLMETDLKNIISKVAIVKDNDNEVGFFYVDIVNHIFTLELSPLTAGFKFTHAMLNDLIDAPGLFISYINAEPSRYSKKVNNLTVKVIDIASIALEKQPSITDIYNQQSASSLLRSKFDNPIEIKEAIEKAARYLIEYDLSKTVKVAEMPSSESGLQKYEETDEDIRPKLLAVLKNYMFEIDHERFFFVSEINEWYPRIKKNQDKDMTEIILNAYDFFNNSNTKNSKAYIDGTVAHLIWSELWNSALSRCLYKRIDGAFKGIRDDANSLTILPISIVESQTSQQVLPEVEDKKNDQNH